MNPQIKEKWISALRSGDYKQTQGNLYESEVGYCCLGVLIDLYIKEKGLKWDTIGAMDRWMCFDDCYEFLPDSVMDWAGLEDNRGTYDNLIESPAPTLADLNDDGSSFSEIADVIESKF